MQAYIQDNKSNLDIDKSVSVKKSFSGFEGSKSYGIITIVPHTILNSFYELFHNFNIRYVFPAITAYSILNCYPTENYSGFLDLKEILLTFAVYHKGILIWISDFLYSDTYEYKNTHNKVKLAMVNDAVIRAINAAQGHRLYVSRILLSGIIADTSGIVLAMSELLETKCSLYTHENEGIAVGSEISTLVGVIRGALYPK